MSEVKNERPKRFLSSTHAKAMCSSTVKNQNSKVSNFRFYTIE